MKKLLFLSAIAFSLSSSVKAATYTNNGTGLFSAGATWIGGVAPSASGDGFVITNGTVLYNVDNSSTTGWGASQIQKGGQMLVTNSPSNQVRMLQNGNITIANNGQFNVGTAAAPIQFYGNELQGFVYQPTNAAQIVITSQTNSFNWFGVTNHQASTILTANAPSGTNSITVAALPPSVGSNDVLLVVNGSSASQNSYFYIVSAVTNNSLYFKPLALLGAETNFWPRTAFSATIPSAFPSNSVVSFISCPVAVVEPSYLNQSVSVGGNSNTLSGVLISVQYGFFQQSIGQALNNCTLSGNNGGGACYNYCSATTLNNCTLSGNSGGGACYNCSATTLNNCTLSGNNNGGACNYCSATTLNNCANDTNFLFSQCYQCFVFGTKYNLGDSFGIFQFVLFGFVAILILLVSSAFLYREIVSVCGSTFFPSLFV